MAVPETWMVPLCTGAAGVYFDRMSRFVLLRPGSEFSAWKPAAVGAFTAEPGENA